MLTPRPTPHPGPRRVEMDQGGWGPIATPWAKPGRARPRVFLFPAVLLVLGLALVIILVWPIR